LQLNVFRLAVTDHHTLGKNVEEVGVQAKIGSTSHDTRVVARRRLIAAAQALR
jgi:hypothetical protein